MEYVKIFLYGFLFVYAIQILELVMQVLTLVVEWFASYMSVILTEHQVTINKYQKEISDEQQHTEKQPLIGFVLDDEYK